MELLEKINSVVWGLPALAAILGVGLYLSLGTGFAQFRYFPKALKSFVQLLRPKDREKGSSSRQALFTALAATVGTGNLVGVAGAICLGGPGAVFWMWIAGCLGMCTKVCEAMLAVRFRKISDGETVGGPMYMITQGLGRRWWPMAAVYAVFGLVASFGVGNATQINSASEGIQAILAGFGIRVDLMGKILIGCFMAALIVVLLMGGGKQIGRSTEKLVPFAAGAYILLCLCALAINRKQLPQAFLSIVAGAWNPRAVTGGLVGSLFVALRVGCARGVFTNEAGLGTAGIAHAAAEVEHPLQQGLMGIMEVFLDTLVICSMTALVILTSGVPIPYGTDAGAVLATRAFSAIFGDWAGIIISLSLCLFALATVLGWGLYGGRCAQFLFGGKFWRSFVLVQGITVILGTVTEPGIVWLGAEIVNGLMAIPNLIALAGLSPEVIRLIKDYEKRSPSVW